MENILDRLLLFMEQEGLNPNKITVQAGLSVGLIGKAKKTNAGLNSDSIEKILHTYPNLSANWLLTGRGNMITSENGVISIVKSEPVTNSSDLLDRIVSLSGENALLKQKIEELEKQKIYNQPPKYGAIAEPISELKKGIKDYNKPIPENQLVTHKK